MTANKAFLKINLKNIENTYRLLIHKIISLKKRRLYGRVVLKPSIRFGSSSTLKCVRRYWYWKISPVPITIDQSSLKKIDEFGQIPVKRRPISTGRPMVLVGIIVAVSRFRCRLRINSERNSARSLHAHRRISFRINMEIGCDPTWTAADQSRTLDVYFRQSAQECKKKLLRSNDDCRLRARNRREWCLVTSGTEKSPPPLSLWVIYFKNSSGNGEKRDESRRERKNRRTIVKKSFRNKR